MAAPAGGREPNRVFLREVGCGFSRNAQGRMKKFERRI
jgi:hypothetical protein